MNDRIRKMMLKILYLSEELKDADKGEVNDLEIEIQNELDELKGCL